MNKSSDRPALSVFTCAKFFIYINPQQIRELSQQIIGKFCNAGFKIPRPSGFRLIHLCNKKSPNHKEFEFYYVHMKLSIYRFLSARNAFIIQNICLLLSSIFLVFQVKTSSLTMFIEQLIRIALTSKFTKI